MDCPGVGDSKKMSEEADMTRWRVVIRSGYGLDAIDLMVASKQGRSRAKMTAKTHASEQVSE